MELVRSQARPSSSSSRSEPPPTKPTGYTSIQLDAYTMKRRRGEGEGRKQSASGAEPRQGGRSRGPGTSASDRAGRRVPQGPAERPTGDQVDWRAFPPGGQHTASYYRGRGRDDRSKPARRGAGRPVREEGEGAHHQLV